MTKWQITEQNTLQHGNKICPVCLLIEAVKTACIVHDASAC